MADPDRLSRDELEAQAASPLPAKEVYSLLDLNVDIDLALDLAAPIDLAIAANANVAAPINAAVSANVLAFGSTGGALADQGVMIDQHIAGAAIAHAPQTTAIDQSNDTVDDGGTAPDPVTVTEGTLMDGPLLNVNVDVDVDADLAAAVAGAVAANANVAAPINAGASANILAFSSDSTAIAEQDALNTQDLDGVNAEAIADQDATITQ
jgi:hypothetical protein